LKEITMQVVTSQKERRRNERVPVNLDVIVTAYLGGDGARWLGKIDNLSCGGLKLIADRRFERRTLLNVHVARDGAESESMLCVHVVYVQSQPEGRWAMGCRFLKEISDQELDEFVKR
jgi:hypothetical protein